MNQKVLCEFAFLTFHTYIILNFSEKFKFSRHSFRVFGKFLENIWREFLKKISKKFLENFKI